MVLPRQIYAARIATQAFLMIMVIVVQWRWFYWKNRYKLFQWDNKQYSTTTKNVQWNKRHRNKRVARGIKSGRMAITTGYTNISMKLHDCYTRHIFNQVVGDESFYFFILLRMPDRVLNHKSICRKSVIKWERAVVCWIHLNVTYYRFHKPFIGK